MLGVLIAAEEVVLGDPGQDLLQVSTDILEEAYIGMLLVELLDPKHHRV